MKITKDMLKDMAHEITQDKRSYYKDEYRKFLMYHGKVREVVKDAITKEFKKVETVEELCNRIVPLNITKKVVDKLAGVYKESPVRKLDNEDSDDSESFKSMLNHMEFDLSMKEANRDFKRSKKALIELFPDDEKKPSMRTIPAHNFKVFALNKEDKSKPNVITKIDWDKEVLYFWSDESHWVTDLRGAIDKEKMQKNDNPDGKNPYGFLPFVYINESSDEVEPLSDDDLLGISIVVPLLLTDLLFGMKYQCWAIIYTIGVEGEIPFNPNSVVHLDKSQEGEQASVGMIKPEIDSDKLLSVVVAIVSMLLSTKNLKSESFDGSSPQSAASGVSKMLDSAESVEDKKDQQAYFLRAENQLFEKLFKLIPMWLQNGLIEDEGGEFKFSGDVTVSTTLVEPKAYISEDQQIDRSLKKLKAGMTTLKRELQKFHPELSDPEIDQLIDEIIEERQRLGQGFYEGIQRGQSGGEGNGVQS